MREIEEKIIEIMKDNGIDIVATLPCDKAKSLFYLIPQHFHDVALNKEEDGIGICAGAYLAGGKPAIVMQSSGLGQFHECVDVPYQNLRAAFADNNELERRL